MKGARVSDLRFDGRQIQSFVFYDEIGRKFRFDRFTVRDERGEVWYHHASPESLIHATLSVVDARPTNERDLLATTNNLIEYGISDTYVFDKAIYEGRCKASEKPHLHKDVTFKFAYAFIQAVHDLRWYHEDTLLEIDASRSVSHTIYGYIAMLIGLRGTLSNGTNTYSPMMASIRFFEPSSRERLAARATIQAILNKRQGPLADALRSALNA